MQKIAIIGADETIQKLIKKQLVDDVIIVEIETDEKSCLLPDITEV